MGKLVDKYIDVAKKRYPREPEFIQTVEEVLESIEPVLEAHPEYIKAGMIERMIEPERTIIFRVPWVDDDGYVRVNRGYRVQFSSVLGPYKGGLRFAPDVYIGTLKFLAFEQVFKNSLTGLPMGGGKGGADFDPNGKSDGEIMRFCQAYVSELFKYIGPNEDVPAGDIGVGEKEIGFMMGQYKKLANRYDGTWTGKGIKNGGLPGRTEATGFGIVIFAREMLRHFGEEMKDKTVAISGFGNVSWGTAVKLNELGAKVVTISGPDGYIYDPDGVSGEKVDYMLELRNSGENICKPYAEKFPGAKFVPGKKPWEVKADLYIPCAVQNEIDIDEAKHIVENGGKFLCEGANMPTTTEAIEYLCSHGVVVGPSKAANAGGVACSCLEMGQSAQHIIFPKEGVYKELEKIMVNIHDISAEACERYGLGYDLIKGANIAAFERVAEAMMLQGIV